MRYEKKRRNCPPRRPRCPAAGGRDRLIVYIPSDSRMVRDLENIAVQPAKLGVRACMDHAFLADGDCGISCLEARMGTGGGETGLAGVRSPTCAKHALVFPLFWPTKPSCRADRAGLSLAHDPLDDRDVLQGFSHGGISPHPIHPLGLLCPVSERLHRLVSLICQGHAHNLTITKSATGTSAQNPWESSSILRSSLI